MKLSKQDIDQFTRSIDSLVIVADTLPQLYRKLNTLARNLGNDWQTLRSPVWREGLLIAVVVRPAKE